MFQTPVRSGKKNKGTDSLRFGYPPKKNTLPSAPFVLSKEEQDIANSRVMSVTMPRGLDWKQRKLFHQSGFGKIKLVE